MNKNIVVAGITTLFVVVVGGFTLAGFYDEDRFNPAPTVKSEIQHCETDQDCQSFYLYCGGGCPIAVSSENNDRYQALFDKRCQLNSPSTMAKAICKNRLPVCIENVCGMLPYSAPITKRLKSTALSDA